MTESAEKLENNYEQAGEEAWDEHNSEPEAELEAEPEAEPEEEAEPEAEAEAEPEAEEEPEAEPESKFHAQEHWNPEYKEAFASLDDKGRETLLNRERQYEHGIQQKSTELNQAKQATNYFQETLKPLVPDWTRQGLAPAQGFARMAAREADLREDPTKALLSLAQEFGVDLNKAHADQPYIDPQTRAAQDVARQAQEEVALMRREQEEGAQRQQQTLEQNASRQLQAFASTQDEAGQPKYPHVNDDLFRDMMVRTIQTGQANNLADAYESTQHYLRNHPLFKASVTDSTKETQARVNKAKSASKKVSGTTDNTKTKSNADADTLKLLEDAGFE